MLAVTEDEMASRWVQYKSNPTLELRDTILRHYLPLVERSARRLRNRLPASVEVQDLVGWGFFGLVEAVESYDHERSTRFSSFAARRILGAMLDELRSLDWLPRLVRAATRRVAQADAELRNALNRPPTDEELSHLANLPPRRFQEASRGTHASVFVPLVCDSESTSRWRETSLPSDGGANDPTREVQHRQLRELIMTGLGREDRLIITLYYYEELTLREVGQVLGISESRVSQRHSSVVKRLQARLKLQVNGLAA